MYIDTAQMLMTAGLMYYTYNLHAKQREDLRTMCTTVRSLTNHVAKRMTAG